MPRVDAGVDPDPVPLGSSQVADRCADLLEVVRTVSPAAVDAEDAAYITEQMIVADTLGPPSPGITQPGNYAAPPGSRAGHELCWRPGPSAAAVRARRSLIRARPAVAELRLG